MVGRVEAGHWWSLLLVRWSLRSDRDWDCGWCRVCAGRPSPLPAKAMYWPGLAHRSNPAHCCLVCLQQNYCFLHNTASLLHYFKVWFGFKLHSNTHTDLIQNVKYIQIVLGHTQVKVEYFLHLKPENFFMEAFRLPRASHLKTHVYCIYVYWFYPQSFNTKLKRMYVHTKVLDF